MGRLQRARAGGGHARVAAARRVAVPHRAGSARPRRLHGPASRRRATTGGTATSGSGSRVAVDNLTDKFYREQFQFAPARGRSFTLSSHREGRTVTRSSRRDDGVCRPLPPDSHDGAVGAVRGVAVPALERCGARRTSGGGRSASRPTGSARRSRARSRSSATRVLLTKLWYIAGALLGGYPLAQGSLYLSWPRRLANVLTVVSLTFVIVAAVLVVLSPVNLAGARSRHARPGRSSPGSWVRLLTPFINLYAVFFLIGGAIRSAWRHYRERGHIYRAAGNALDRRSARSCRASAAASPRSAWSRCSTSASASASC